MDNIRFVIPSKGRPDLICERTLKMLGPYAAQTHVFVPDREQARTYTASICEHGIAVASVYTVGISPDCRYGKPVAINHAIARWPGKWIVSLDDNISALYHDRNRPVTKPETVVKLIYQMLNDAMAENVTLAASTHRFGKTLDGYKLHDDVYGKIYGIFSEGARGFLIPPSMEEDRLAGFSAYRKDGKVMKCGYLRPYVENHDLLKGGIGPRHTRSADLVAEHEWSQNYYGSMIRTYNTYEHPYYPGLMTMTDLNEDECLRNTGRRSAPTWDPNAFAKAFNRDPLSDGPWHRSLIA